MIDSLLLDALDKTFEQQHVGMVRIGDRVDFNLGITVAHNNPRAPTYREALMLAVLKNKPDDYAKMMEESTRGARFGQWMHLMQCKRPTLWSLGLACLALVPTLIVWIANWHWPINPALAVAGAIFFFQWWLFRKFALVERASQLKKMTDRLTS